MQLQAVAALGSLALVCACLPAEAKAATIVSGTQVARVQPISRVPAAILQQAGIELPEGSRLLNLGQPVDPTVSISQEVPIHLQVRVPVQVTVNGAPLQTLALTVAEALQDAGVDLFGADTIEPPADAPIIAGLAISHSSATEHRLLIDERDMPLRSSADSTGVALAAAGLGPIGLDSSSPAADEELPADNQLRLHRVSEALVLEQDPIPFKSQSENSAELELGLEQILEPGRMGLAVTRTRIRYKDGVEAARQVEPKVVVRPPTDRRVVRGTKLVEKSITLDGTTFNYWHSMQMYATVYSPCNSGTGSCSTGTASGLPAGKGVVAVDPDLYAQLNGQRLYVPAYGYAVVGDVGGGYIVEQNLGISRYKWIDLGFDDNNIQDMTGWVTVYFLSPIPATIPDVLR